MNPSVPAAGPSVERAAEYPRPRHVLVHISDTHFVPQRERLLSGVADVRAHLSELLGGLEDSGVRPDALVFTGDLADRGEPAAYASLRALVEPLAHRIGAQPIWVMGNHDDREAMREHLLGDAPAVEPYDRVVWLGGLRIVVLDSTVPGHAHGEITGDQHRWLAGVLAVPAPQGTILALHHPPVPCIQDLAVTVELRDQQALADTLAGSDVRCILGGHMHYSASATFAGIPVSVASATCYTQDLLAPGRGTRGRDGAQAFNLVHVHEHTVLNAVVPIGTHATVGRPADQAETARLLAEAGMRIPDAEQSDRPATAGTGPAGPVE